MATKAYVNQKDNLKADKATTLSGYGITDAYTKDETYNRDEIDGKDGDLTTLKTSDKTNLVKAINEIHDVTKGVVALYNKNVEAGAGANGWTDLLVNNADDKPLRNVIVEQIESIADLSKIEKINKRTVFVKSYYTGKGKGGGTFVYDATKSTINDGALVFNGWVRQLDSDVFTPYMSGCKCDGTTDDAQNLDKLNLALYRNKLQGRIIFDSDILINSELPRTENLAFVDTALKVGVRLVGGVHLEIKKGVSIKIGNHFDDSSTNVFCGANYQSADDWQDIKHQDNVHIFGGGTIDSTAAGGMTSKHSTQRYLIMLGGLSNFKM